MNNSKWTITGKWLAGIIATVISGVLVYWLTDGSQGKKSNEPPPSPTTMKPFTSSPSPPLECRIQGIWKVVQNSQTTGEMLPGQTTEHWEVMLNGGQLSIQVIQNFHMPRMYWSRTQLTVTNIAISGCKFSFVTYVSDSIQKTTTLYNLTFTGQEILEGSFQATDRGVPELPNLVMTGTVTMVKEPAPQI